MRKIAVAIVFILLPIIASAWIMSGSIGNFTAPVTVTDNFVRADENPLTATHWTTATGMSALKIVSNAAKGSTNATHNLSYWNSYTFSDAQFSQCTYTNAASAIFSGPAVRWSGNSGYFYQIDMSNGGSNSYLQRWSSGSQTTLATFAFAYSPNDTLKVTAIGDNIALYRNGTLIHSHLDNATVHGGAPGLWTYTNLSAATYWSGGDL